MSRQFWDERYEGQELIWTAQPNRFLVSEVDAVPPGRALDVGTGEGRNAVWLATRGWRVTGVDFSAAGLGKARRLADASGVEVEWVLADLVEYEPPAGAFDLVAVLYLHLPAPQRRLVHRRSAGAVAPGGLLLVVGHDRSNLTEGHGGPQDPAILFTPEEVREDLEGLLPVERAERVLRPVSTAEGERQAVDALIRARAPKDLR